MKGFTQIPSYSFLDHSPASLLAFSPSLNKHSAQISLSSQSSQTVLYKIKTNNPRLFVVPLSIGYLSPQESTSVAIWTVPGVSRSLYPRPTSPPCRKAGSSSSP